MSFSERASKPAVSTYSRIVLGSRDNQVEDITNHVDLGTHMPRHLIRKPVLALCQRIATTKTRIVGVAILPLALLNACGGSPDVDTSDRASASVVDQAPSGSATPTPSADPELPAEETLQAYFDAIAKTTVSSYGDAIDLAQPGSPAAAYATYLQASTQASVDGGTAGGDDTAISKKVDGGFEQCRGIGSNQVCSMYTDIKGAGGRVSDFSVNDKPIANRLTVGNGKAVDVKGLEVKAFFIAAFEVSSGDGLLIVVSLKTGKTTSVSGLRASYRSPQGRQSDSSGMEGPGDLGADSLANYAFSFPAANLGGRFTLSMYDEWFSNQGTVTLKTS